MVNLIFFVSLVMVLIAVLIFAETTATSKSLGRLHLLQECIDAVEACERDLPRSKICICEIKTTVTEDKR